MKMKRIVSCSFFFIFALMNNALADYSNGVIFMMVGQGKIAVSEFKKAAAEGHIEATYSLGYMYENAVGGIEKDYSEALKWYRRAVDLGDPKSQYMLASMYNRGRGVEIDQEQAVSYYQMSADQGYAWAEYFLGLKLETGQGIKQDVERAAHFYERAADQEHARAQYNLAKMFLEGRGVEKNLHKAYEWASIANAYAHSDASALMTEISQSLSENDIVVIGDSVKRWIRRHR